MQPPYPAYQAAPPAPKRRWGLLIAGIVGAVFSVIVLIAGAVGSMGAAVVSTVDPVGKAKTPGSITFDADRGRYELYAVHERRGGSIGSGGSFDCEVTLANGKVIEIDGSVQTVLSEVGNTESIGAFNAVPGETVIRCDAGRNGETFIVDKESPWKQASLIATIVGAVMLMAAAGAIVAGALWKRA